MSGICDFCSRPDPDWIYSAYDFEMRPAGWGSAGAWAACNECSALIEQDDHEALLDRVPMLAQLRIGSPALSEVLGPEAAVFVRDQARELHDKFRRERKGPRRAFG